HLAVEAPLQRWCASVPGLMPAFDVSYMLLHLAALGGVLLWLYRCHHRGYVELRTAVLITSAVSLVCFVLLPTAPPRLAGLGIVDSISHFGVTEGSSTLTLFYNPYAAFPSLHEAYAALTGWAIRRQARNRVLWLVGGVVMPIWVAVEVIATGNHFVIDVVAGILTAELGRVVAVRLHRRAAQRSPAKRSSSGTAAPLRSDARTNHSCPKNLP
ncbi:MAG TPA: phosphatase PAP2 family protein, partial [Acidimicrobiales bacterium]|nr:phosphatase PAP2 family protein [Acidimicrobiales bacterium]